MSEWQTQTSECCDAQIFASLGDGVLIGSCSGCGKNVLRKNPRTGALEWLDGNNPWTLRDDLRPAALSSLSGTGTGNKE